MMKLLLWNPAEVLSISCKDEGGLGNQGLPLSPLLSKTCARPSDDFSSFKTLTSFDSMAMVTVKVEVKMKVKVKVVTVTVKLMMVAVIVMAMMVFFFKTALRFFQVAFDGMTSISRL